MKIFLITALSFFLFTAASFSQTYTVGVTEYYSNQTYSTTGKPMVKRSAANKNAFLQSKGFSSTPKGYEVDHIIPLSQGGSDSPYNMQLLTIEQHKAKTARERSNYTTSWYSTSTYKAPTYNTSIPKTKSYSAPSYSIPTSNSSRTIHTGSRGGKYYINSNGNKTYIRD